VSDGDESSPLLKDKLTLQLSEVQSNEINIQSKAKGFNKPWYIISQENKVLNFFKIATGFFAVPSVIFNLFL